jgi:amino acid transporter
MWEIMLYGMGLAAGLYTLGAVTVLGAVLAVGHSHDAGMSPAAQNPPGETAP